MSLQFSVAVRAAMADAIETAIGTGPTLEFWTGSKPANCAASDVTTKVGHIVLPSDWLTNPGDGTKALLGTWENAVGGDAAGSAGYFRIKAGSTCHAQGTVTATSGGGDMTLDNIVLAVSQDIKITSFLITEGNA